MARQYSQIWNNWIKYIYYNENNIFNQDINDIISEAHHINGKGYCNDSKPINIIVIPKLMHKLYTENDYIMVVELIKICGGPNLDPDKHIIDNYFIEKSTEHFDNFIADRNNINNVPQQKYTACITDARNFNGSHFIFNGEITTNEYYGVKIESYFNSNSGIYKILCKHKNNWYPQDFIGTSFNIEICNQNDKNYANLIEILGE